MPYEAVVFAHLDPMFVRLHEGLVLIIGQRRDATFGLRLHHLLHTALCIKLDYRMSVHQLERKACLSREYSASKGCMYGHHKGCDYLDQPVGKDLSIWDIVLAHP